MRRQIMFTLCVVLAQEIFAQDSLKITTLQEVVVSGTKFELPVEKSGKIVLKVSQQELERNTSGVLSEVLNRVPGIQMDGNFSAPGANVSYYVRGGRNRHAVIMLDGIPLTDPSGIEAFYDLRFLSTDQLANLEILQGSLSTLYGSGASAGVIAMQTKESLQEGLHGSLFTGGGSWKTYNQSLHFSGRFNKTSFSLVAENYSSQGFSAAKDEDPLVTFDKDGMKKQNLFGTMTHSFSTSFSLSAFVSYDWLENEFDTWTFTDGNESQKYKQLRFGLKGTYQYNKGNVRVLFQRSDIDREENTSFPSVYEGVNWYNEIIHRHQVSQKVTLLSGITAQQLSYSEENVNTADTTSFTIIDPYTSMLLEFQNGFSLHVGLRLNTHSVYDNQMLYNINPSWMFPISEKLKVKLLASISTAYITPSLYQLHTTWGGNPDLKPEKDISTEYGGTLYVGEKFQLTAVNYYRTETNSIIYSPTFQYENTDQTRYVNGVTVDVSWNLVKQVSVKADYAYTHTNLPKTFYRIPSHKAGASVTIQPVENSYLSLHYQYTGERTDVNFPDEIKLEAFSLLDLTMSQKFLKNKLNAYVTIANVFDQDFIAIYGYTTRGRNVTAGLRYCW